MIYKTFSVLGILLIDEDRCGAGKSYIWPFLFLMKQFLTLSIFLYTSWLFSQTKEGIKKGVLSPAEYHIRLSPSDSSAEAIMLYEKQEVIFTYYANEMIESRYSCRVKILKTSGLDWGNVLVKLQNNDSEKEKLTDIEGYTYNLENGVLERSELTAASVFEEKVSDWQTQKKIILPNVKVGSVIEYHYTRKRPYYLDNTPDTWYFQGKIPFRWSEYIITIPSNLSYRMNIGGYLPLHINTTEEAFSNFNRKLGSKYRLVVKDAPAFKNEQYITTYEDYISKVEFGFISYYSNHIDGERKLATGWKEIVKLLNSHENFGDKLKKTAYLEATAASYNTISDSVEKMRAIFNDVCKNYIWNERNRLLATNDLKAVTEKGRGSSAEINMVLLSLLRKAGFKANPLIMSTRDHGAVRQDFPLVDKLNYTMVYLRLGGKDLLLDATEPLLMPGIIPERCLSNTGYVIEGDTVRAISLKPLKTTSAITINAEIGADGKVKGDYSSMGDSYTALSYRGYMKQNSEKELLELYRKIHPDWEIEHLALENKDDPYKTLKQHFDFSETLLSNTQGKMYIKPMFQMAASENLFREKERLYPVDLSYPYEIIIVLNIRIPDTYMIEDMPKTQAFTLPEKGGKYSYVLEAEGNMISIKSRLLIANAYYPATQYPYLRELYHIMIQKHGEMIVLKKK